MSHWPPGAALRAEHQLHLVHRLERDAHVPEVVAHARPRHARPRPLEPVGVGVLVDVDDGVGAEVDRIRAGDVGAVERVRIEDLRGHRFPAAGRSAVHEARPAGAEAAVLLLEIRDQLVDDGVAVRPQVGGVHRVRVVVVRVGVLDLDHEHAREPGRRPVLVELIRLLVLDPVVAIQVEALRVLALHVRIGRLSRGSRRSSAGSGRG